MHSDVKVKNRKTWNRWMHCIRCRSKLMYYLSKGHTYAETEAMMHELHPNVKRIDQYTKQAVRAATGRGIYDDWILQHKFWRLREPVLADPEMLRELRMDWRLLAAYGKAYMEKDKVLAKYSFNPSGEHG